MHQTFWYSFLVCSNATFYCDDHAANYVIIANIEKCYEPSNVAILAF